MQITNLRYQDAIARQVQKRKEIFMNSANEPTSPWSALEQIDGPVAIESTWRHWLGDRFDSFRQGFLQRGPAPASYVPCPRGCGCAHEVIHSTCVLAHALSQSTTEHDSTFNPQPSTGTRLLAVCRCESWNCDDLLLTPDDVVLWELGWPRLARSLCRALGLDFQPAELGVHNTRQIGSWSADALPVLLTIQSQRRNFRAVIVQLVARLRERFILLAPTSGWVDAGTHELLASVRAGFFDLATYARFAQHGTVQPTRPPGEMFSAFTPQPREPIEGDVARRAFALVQQLDSGNAIRPPSTLAVFRLYCLEDQSIGRIARKYHCSTATVFRRLRAICARTGLQPTNLRRLSPHIARIEDQLSDSRARRIHRERAIEEDDREEEQ